MSFEENTTTIETLRRRAELFLEDRNWNGATEYYGKALDLNPEDAKAYFGLLLAELKVNNAKELIFCENSFSEKDNYKKAVRFASSEYKIELRNYNAENIYYLASKSANSAKSLNDFIKVVELYRKISDYKDSKEKIDLYSQKINVLKAEKDKNKKICIIVISVVAVIALIILIVTSSIKSAENRKIAEEIYNNFLGTTFKGTVEIDEDGFYYGYSSGTLNDYTTYWIKERKEKLVFNEDGTIDNSYISDMYAAAYPAILGKKPQGTHSENEYSINSFKVTVNSKGEVWIIIGGDRCEVIVDSNNVPKEILDYNEVDLYIQ